LLGIFCKIHFTPAVTSCYQVHALNADAHTPTAALLCYSGAAGAETLVLLTALNSPHLHNAADGRCIRNSSCITLLWLHHIHNMSLNYHKNGLVSSHQPLTDGLFVMCFVVRMKLGGYQQPTRLCIKMEFVVGTISLPCELSLLSWSCFRSSGVGTIVYGKWCFVSHVQRCGRCMVSIEYST